MKQHQLGNLKSIKIIENESEILEIITFDLSYFKQIRNCPFKTVEDVKLVAIADTNDLLQNVLDKAVYTIDYLTPEPSFIKVADNFENLLEIIDWIVWIWEPFNERDSLSVHEVDKNTLEEVLTDFQIKNPNSDMDYWRHYAFKGVYGNFL